ncbi:MAG: type II toxin-antitoxin system VapC family toxin [Bifidobacteriaceae bacterium]|jgi:predicted nucleic acid-binding protein|nr:type II toxin-antitoxin system VapC family toxin [Bifidobacteriaceae bacterium]
MVLYCDASAVVKLVFDEPESAALRQWLATSPGEPVVSDLGRAEVLRAVRRFEPGRLGEAVDVLGRFSRVRVDGRVFDAAATIGGPLLRTLDAIHLAAAARLGDQLRAVVTYDQRMAAAAQETGLRVFAPGVGTSTT